MAYPGVLPVLNKESVNSAIRFGLAIDAEISPRSISSQEKIIFIQICPKDTKLASLNYQ